MAIRRDHPYGAFAFRVEIDGVTEAGFAAVEGLDQEIEVIAYREGGDRLASRLTPGMARPAMVTLRRGVDGDMALYDWIRAVREGDLASARRNVRVSLLNELGETVMTWILARAFPVKLEGPMLDAAASETAIESLTLAVEEVRVE